MMMVIRLRFRHKMIILVFIVSLFPLMSYLLFDYSQIISNKASLVHFLTNFLLSFALIAISVILIMRFTRPLDILNRSASKVSAGNLNAKALVNTNDEFQEFAQHFNLMVEKIRQRELDLVEKTKALEESHMDMAAAKKDLEKGINDMKVSRTAMLNIMEDMNAANEKLKSLDRAKDEFLSIVSHELKTPLTPIKTYLEMLLDGDLGPLRTRQEESLKVVARNVTRLKMLIDDLLDITRLDAGQMKLMKEETDISELIKAIVKDKRIIFKDKEIAINTRIGKTAKAYIDPNRITQVITNLVDNSIKFTPSGGKITIELKSEKGQALVAVKDTGIGIAQENIPRIFGKFYQVDSSLSRKYGGTGLGLCICKGIVERHDGRIWVESVLGKSTSVNFSLPIKPKNYKRK